MAAPAGTEAMMTEPEGLSFGYDTPEADVVDQHIEVNANEDDTWLDTDHVTAARDWEASEADLIDQAIVVPLPEDDPDFNR
jgi:hypothetical protein